MEQETAILITGVQQHKADACQRLPAAVIDKIKVYDKPSNPSTLTGIDDTDPLVVMAAQIEDIRSRGQQLNSEIAELINN